MRASTRKWQKRVLYYAKIFHDKGPVSAELYRRQFKRVDRWTKAVREWEKIVELHSGTKAAGTPADRGLESSATVQQIEGAVL